MAEVEYGHGFELDRGIEGIRGVLQILMWRGLWRFLGNVSCQAAAGNAIVSYVSRKCTLKIKYGVGSTTLELKLTKIPIRD
ncbi:MAG: hypothetical protein F6K40_36870 [Okeania sp. SIO3I5]|uniref:hypothetical protein n=1 Tax=Okeania sp. SIO3I5 TaxID=2607805 RepID=UPI0013B67493|nr:hypothetical protein [Okeania sp. SIO3I5]NEQ41470.1 hypothetical protein [Okeania sp. SIO3I5]